MPSSTISRRGERGNALPYVIGALVLVVAVALGVSVALGGDDDSDTTAGAAGGGNALVYGDVSVPSSPLPSFEGDTASDVAVGQAAPIVQGQAFDASGVTLGGSGEPTMVVFLAHWCPHCQAELPVLVEEAAAGTFDDMRTVAVLTSTNSDAPNFPPAAWLAEEGWTGEVLVDDEAGTAGAAYGLSSFPFIVWIDADGNVVARVAGEAPASTIAEFSDLARG